MFDVNRWELLAEEVTTIAENMQNPDAKRMMLAVANDYMALARRSRAIAQSSDRTSHAR